MISALLDSASACLPSQVLHGCTVRHNEEEPSKAEAVREHVWDNDAGHDLLGEEKSPALVV